MGDRSACAEPLSAKAQAGADRLSTVEAARRLGINWRSVSRLCKLGRLEAEKNDAGHWRIEPASIKAYRASVAWWHEPREAEEEDTSGIRDDDLLARIERELRVFRRARTTVVRTASSALFGGSSGMRAGYAVKSNEQGGESDN